jgi:hypothetical protein
MIRVIFSLLIVAQSLFSYGQSLGQFDIVNGFEKYPLGSMFKDVDTSLRLVVGGTFEHNGRVEYSYQHLTSIKKPYEFAGVSFQSIILTYISSKLVREYVFQVYIPKSGADYKKKAKREFKQLYSYLMKQWKTKGEKKTLYNTSSYVVKGYKWELHGHSMTFTFHETKGAYPSCTIEIYLELDEYK